VRPPFRHALLVGAVLTTTLAAPARGQVEAPTPIDEVRPMRRSSMADAGAPEPVAPNAPTASPATSRPSAEPASEHGPNPILSPAAEPASEHGPNPILSPAAEPASEHRAKPLLAPTATDKDLFAAWHRWQKGIHDPDARLAEEAQGQLLALKGDLGIADLDAFAIGFARAAEAKVTLNDAMGAVTLASAAVELAPDLPLSHFMLARAYAFADPADVSRYVSALAHSVRCLWTDPRYRRAALADLGICALLALLATAAAVIGVLFLREVRQLLHDFHHLFPKATMRWQPAVFVFVLLSLPVVLRLGPMPVVLVLFAAAAVYISMRERVVAIILLALVSLAPVGAGWIASASTFPGTVAEDVYQLERGGTEAASSAAVIRRRAADKSAQFEELLALGRYELRRGQLDAAIAHLELAAAKRSNEPRLLTNLGNALLGKADAEGAAQSYTTASSVDPSLVAPFYNLAILYTRRATAASSVEAAAADTQRAQTVGDVAQRLEPSLLTPTLAARETGLNRALLSPGLSSQEIERLVDPAERDAQVQSQLSLQLLGNVDPSIAWLYPMAFAFAASGLGALVRRPIASRACARCGRAVCRRCDPELSVGSALCQQCVNVFARKNVVEPAVKIRKQIEVAQYRAEREKLTYAVGLLCCGAGHVFSGLPVRGALHAFFFSLALFSIVCRHGVVRYPYGAEPLFGHLALFATAMIAVYLLSLRGLYKQQS